MTSYDIIKISDLPELTSIADDDLLVVVDVSEPVESNKTKKIQKSNITANIVSILQSVYPIGSIYISAISTNPATLFGFGTWSAFGAGRVPVGFDAGQTEFNSAEKTGGAKTHTLTSNQMPSHTHTQNAHNHDIGQLWRVQNLPSGGDGVYVFAPTGATKTGNTTATNQNTGGGTAHNNLQPYITVYMWKRTA